MPLETTPARAGFEDYQLSAAEIIGDVFGTMLGLEVHVMQEINELRWPPEGDVLTAAVYFAGSWKGAVLLACRPAQARQFAERLTSAAPAAPEDVCDALGELANMIGGNLKALIATNTGATQMELSMPSVVEGIDYSMRLCRGNAVSRLAVSGEMGAFWVMLVEMIPPV